MPSTASDGQLLATPPPTVAAGSGRALTRRQSDVLRAIGRGLNNTEIAESLGIPYAEVARHIARIFTTLGLRDRAAAIVYAFDHGIVTPRRPRTPVPTPPAPAVSGPVARTSTLHISVLGPLRAWCGGRQLDLGPVRQQALLAALVLRPNVSVSQSQLLDRVWGIDQPMGNVVPVYVYRLRRCLRTGDDKAGAAIGRDRIGYRFLGAGVRVDSAELAELVTEADAAERAGDLAEAVRGYGRALELFQGEPLALLPGPFAELERLRLTEHRLALALRRLDWQLRLGRHADAVGELLALAATHPHSEAVAALLMRALHGGGRQADALAVFDRTRDRLRTDLDVAPGEVLRKAQRAVLTGRAA